VARRLLELLLQLKSPASMPKAKTGVYAVAKGFTPGIYETWNEAEAQVKGEASCRYRKVAQSRIKASRALSTKSSERAIKLRNGSRPLRTEVPALHLPLKVYDKAQRRWLERLPTRTTPTSLPARAWARRPLRARAGSTAMERAETMGNRTRSLGLASFGRMTQSRESLRAL
jgi:hypothetical protein